MNVAKLDVVNELGRTRCEKALKQAKEYVDYCEREENRKS